MAASGKGEDRLRALRIVSKCSSVDEFVSIFRRFCDEKSLFIVTKRPKSLGAKPQFTITLADGKPMLKGVGTVVESYPDRHNSFGRPGMKLRFEELDPSSQEILRRLNQARKSKKNTPPPLPRHMRPKSEGEPVPPASPALTGLGDADSLDAADATQVDAEPLVEASPAPAKEERRKGSDFVLPANPFGELTDASLEAFVECTLYEETGTFDVGLGEPLGQRQDEEEDDEDATAVEAEPGPDRDDDVAVSGAEEPTEDTSAVASSGRTSRPITVPVSIPPVKEGGAESREQSPAGSPLSRSLASAQSAAASRAAAAAGAAPASSEGAEAGTPASRTPGAPATAVPSSAPLTAGGHAPVAAAGAAPANALYAPPTGAAAPPGQPTPMPGQPTPMPGQPTPMPGQRTDLTPLPQPAASGRAPEITEPVTLDALPRRTWGVWHMVAAGGITLIVGLIIGYALWGSENGAGENAGKRAAHSSAGDDGRAPPDAAASKQLTASAGPTASAMTGDAGVVDGGADRVAVATTPSDDAGTASETPDATEAGTPLADASACEIELITEPDGALVAVGRRRLGKTPYVGELPCDADSVKIAHPRYANLSREITPVPGERIALQVKLERPTFKLRVVSSPKGAAVYVGGRRAGTTPVTTHVTGFERTTVKVSKRGYKTYSRQVYPKKPLITITTALQKSSARKRSTRRKTR